MADILDFKLPALLLSIFFVYRLTAKYYKASHAWVDVPVLGGYGILGSWIAGFRWSRKARSLIQEGYKKYRDSAFQVATANGWEIFICNDDMIKEYRNLMDNQMSANAVTAELFQTKYTLPGAAEGIHKIPIPILSKGLTWLRTRAATKTDPYFPEFVEEFLHAFSEELHLSDKGWNAVPCFETGTRMVAHLTAKSLVGRPMCRDPEIIDLFSTFGNVVPTSGFFITMFPEYLKPLAAMFCSAPKVSDRLNTMITLEIGKRRANPRKMPQDLTDWLMKWVDENAPDKYSDWDVCLQIVSSIFGAIHTTTQVLVHSLFEIATRKEYVEPLRQEIEESLREYGGWVKEGLESMKKLDSFIKECQRYNPLDSGSLARRTTKDFKFSNGLRIPEGNFIFTPNAPVLFDQTYYPNADQFDGFRFYKMREQPEQTNNHTFVSTNPKYLQFGDGRHTCPGRYMAADEIRMMLAYMLINYDITTENNGPRPGNTFFKKILFPDMKAHIMIRKRET
ncbi:MAG: hypothetical protein M1834_007211 [Cirrosporium novae-zelandiae]|nr:MAG: hypothetical protein M1834_007211 [Cirrosporium novae-zelandiae]